ncbi:MAG: hypothetical protein KC462_07355, partial [Cyanobacteria bacterium HKST-UBA05]|nr:hypothetical protein [Cyanobacteria bacterium HKST-UBA05]
MEASIFSPTSLKASTGIDASNNQGGGGGGGLFYMGQGQEEEQQQGFIPPPMLPIDFSVYDSPTFGFGGNQFAAPPSSDFGARIKRLARPLSAMAAES